MCWTFWSAIVEEKAVSDEKWTSNPTMDWSICKSRPYHHPALEYLQQVLDLDSARQRHHTPLTKPRPWKPRWTKSCANFISLAFASSKISVIIDMFLMFVRIGPVPDVVALLVIQRDVDTSWRNGANLEMTVRIHTMFLRQMLTNLNLLKTRWIP